MTSCSGPAAICVWGSVTGATLCPRRTLLLPCPQFVHRWWINCGNLCPRADHLVSMNTEPMESIIYGSRYSAGRLSLAVRWIRAKEDPDIRVVRDRFEAFVHVGSVVTVTGVDVEDPRPGCSGAVCYPARLTKWSGKKKMNRTRKPENHVSGGEAGSPSCTRDMPIPALRRRSHRASTRYGLDWCRTPHVRALQRSASARPSAAVTGDAGQTYRVDPRASMIVSIPCIMEPPQSAL
jgi:hypothetical protein